MIRIFDYVNISNVRGGLWRDSGYHVQRNVINYTLRRRNDIFFYVTCPHGEEGDFLRGIECPDRIKLIPIKYTTAGSLNKLYFDVFGIRKKFKWSKYPVTVILNNEAYLGPSFLQLFKATLPFSSSTFANYVHWVELPEVNRLGNSYKGNWQMWTLATSIFWSDMTYMNSDYGISLILPYFRKILRGDIYDITESKLSPLQPGFNHEEMDRFKTSEKFDKVTFIFNHRLSQYTGAAEVLRVAKRLIDDGYDFNLIITNPSLACTKSARSQLYKDKEKYLTRIIFVQNGLPYSKYIETLWKSDAIIAWHGGRGSDRSEPVNQWSISTLEGVACGCYPIAPRRGFFEEILPPEFLLQQRNEESLYTIMRIIIDSPNEFRKKASIAQSYVRERFTWEALAPKWIKALEELHNKTLQNASKLTTHTINRITKIIENEGYFKWSDLMEKIVWHSQIRIGRISPYFWLSENYEESPTPEPVFYSKKGKLGDLL